MKPAVSLVLFVALISSVYADKSVVEKNTIVTNGRNVTSYSVEDNSCKIIFETIVNTKFDKTIKYLKKKKEKCINSIGYDFRVNLYKIIISEIAASGFLKGDSEMTVVWGGLYEMTPLRCKLIRYAANSVEWAKLIEKNDNRPVEFHESTPLEFSVFIRNSAVLSEVENIFALYGFYLNDIKIRSFRSVSVNDLNAFEHKCVERGTEITIFPYDAQIYMSFKTRPTK